MDKVRTRLLCLKPDDADSEHGANDSKTNKRPLWLKILIISGLILLIILVLVFVAIWVIFPIVFMNSISIQRFFMFFNLQDPKNPIFDDPQKYGIDGVLNFYITTKDLDNSTAISIGAWLILHEDDANSTDLNQKNVTASKILSETTRPISIYLHGVGCNRIKAIKTYNVLRKHFLVISPDHRGFGDSGPDVEPSELGIVSDTVQLYRWIRSNTENEIFVWGHSLGTALSTHSVKNLYENHGVVPMGLVLEAAFTTMRDEVGNNAIGKLFNWLPYFEATVQTPLERNGFLFLTTTNILSVNCPILIMHAEDDDVIPYEFGVEVAEVARTKRNISEQGNVTFHLFGSFGYQHVGITDDPNMSKYIHFICTLVFLFALIFVGFPVAFMNSIGLQRLIIFTHFNLPNTKEYFEKYKFPGFKNRYVTVEGLGGKNKSLGVWQILPVSLASEALRDPNFDYDKALLDSRYGVLIYFHGTGEARSYNSRKYQLLSYYFHIIAFDYRNYADSSPGVLSEKAVVNDCVQLYEWVKNRTNSPIYVWGHSLGAALATSTVAALEKSNVYSHGLVLESGFTSLREELYFHPYGKLFAWLPWFKLTVVDPLYRNGFIFDTALNIQNVSCPIMILHAQDDRIVPYKFGEELYKIGRNRSGNVPNDTVYHEFDAELKYDHFYIYQDPFLKFYIMDFFKLTKRFFSDI